MILSIIILLHPKRKAIKEGTFLIKSPRQCWTLHIFQKLRRNPNKILPFKPLIVKYLYLYLNIVQIFIYEPNHVKKKGCGMKGDIIQCVSHLYGDMVEWVQQQLQLGSGVSKIMIKHKH